MPTITNFVSFLMPLILIPVPTIIDFHLTAEESPIFYNTTLYCPHSHQHAPGSVKHKGVI